MTDTELIISLFIVMAFTTVIITAYSFIQHCEYEERQRQREIFIGEAYEKRIRKIELKSKSMMLISMKNLIKENKKLKEKINKILA